jgi:carbon storage regulator CsrA
LEGWEQQAVGRRVFTLSGEKPIPIRSLLARWRRGSQLPAKRKLGMEGANGKDWGEYGMLVLARRKNEALVIGDLVRVTFLGTQGDRVRLGIQAPDFIGVAREEIWGGNTQPQKDAEALWSPS